MTASGEIKAIVLDLDGTLLDSQKRISGRNRRAVEACMERGERIIVATARPPRAVKLALPEEWFAACSIVSYNGAHTSCPALGWVNERNVSPELTGSVIGDVLSADPQAELSIEHRDRWYSYRDIEFRDRLNAVTNAEVMELDRLKELSAAKILIGSYSEGGALAERYADRLHVLVTDGGTLVQITSHEASKEAAVAELCRRHGIGMAEVAAFGDDTNDIGLFQAVGYPVAMGNAIPELKRIARIVTDTNDADGVAAVLEAWLGFEGTKFPRGPG
jgi:Cof subfamily protein (haloacid dehalogenase superfamily)